MKSGVEVLCETVLTCRLRLPCACEAYHGVVIWVVSAIKSAPLPICSCPQKTGEPEKVRLAIALWLLRWVLIPRLRFRLV